MANTIDYVSSHPIIAFIVMTIHIGMTVAIYEFQLPTIVMQLFQILAWSVTITVGLITIYKFFKKKK